MGCSAPEVAPPVPLPSVADTVAPDPAAVSMESPQPRPVRVEVVDRGIDGEVMVAGLGVDAGGGFAEPSVDEPQLASWYNLGPVPGERGPSVVLGHVNGGGSDGIFAFLDMVVEGDRVIVYREDGSQIAFDVYRKQKISKLTFPHEEVFGPTDGSEIRLITCGGDLDRSAGSYRDNVIVYAKLVQVLGS